MEPQQKDFILKGALEQAKGLHREGYALMDYAPQVAGYLQQQPGVEEVRDYKGSDITVRFQDSTQVTVLLGREAQYGGAPATPSPATPAAAPAYRDPPHPAWIKAGVIDPLWDDWPPQSTPTSIVGTLRAQGYRVEHVKAGNVDLNFMTKLDQKRYGVIFIRTHGGIEWVGSDPKLHIMVRPFFDSYPPASGYTGVGVFYVGTDWGAKYAYAFNDQFVSAYMSGLTFPDTLMHLLVCYGAATDAENDMIPAFLSRGMGCYSGWTLTASATYGDPAAVTFFQRMAGGDTVAQATAHIAASGSSPDPDTGAVLVAHGDSGMHLQLPFIGNKRTKELHQPTCRWVRLMSLRNVRFFETVQDALNVGYNGCAYCLPQYDTG